MTGYRDHSSHHYPVPPSRPYHVHPSHPYHVHPSHPFLLHPIIGLGQGPNVRSFSCAFASCCLLSASTCSLLLPAPCFCSCVCLSLASFASRVAISLRIDSRCKYQRVTARSTPIVQPSLPGYRAAAP